MSQAKDLQQGLAALGLDLSDTMRQQLLGYLALLDKWNRVYNLTAIRDPRQMVGYHLLDGLAVLPHLWPGRWLDVGCGAGLPGIVLAIARPDWTFVLLDSNSKKMGFVQQSVIQLGLKNVSAYCGRVEDYRPLELFDGIVSRAFAELGDFARLTATLAKPGGKWAALKGHAEQELPSLPQSFDVEKMVSLQVPGVVATRSLVVVKRKGE
ncbi:MAG: 16S rRNA (guanine(527)-N(7))-methyltransferase RsmG [Gallionella sp.]|nr:16S rRNA (guanine(527)-N(7))-methyltransferase RsmG [Gallionella sp.]